MVLSLLRRLNEWNIRRVPTGYPVGCGKPEIQPAKKAEIKRWKTRLGMTSFAS